MRNVQRYITHVHSSVLFRLLNLLFGGVFVAVAAVIFVSSLLITYNPAHPRCKNL